MDFPWTMRQVVSLLPIPQPPKERSAYNIDCPCCGDRKKHLYIDLDGGWYCCPRCGFKGGMLALYGYYHGLDAKRAYAQILQALGGGSPSSIRQPKAEPKVLAQQAALRPVEDRHAVYSALLNHLPLERDHAQNLRNRGLRAEDMQANGYRTLTAGSGRRAAKMLSGYSLEGIPGFYMEAGQWSLCCPGRGFLVPVRDREGRILGMQLRLDDARRRKYRWISSGKLPNGSGARCWLHVAGAPDRGEVLITEGPLKADIIRRYTGKAVIALPGVSALGGLPELLRNLSPRLVMTALDMDFLNNPNVLRGYLKLREVLDGLDLAYGTYLWDPRQKGLDDYLRARELRPIKEEEP